MQPEPGIASDRPHLVITDARLVTTDTGPTAGTVDITIEAGTITSVEPHATGSAPGTSTARLDARGGFCLPGLVNTHNHSPLMIVRGIVEDLGFAPAYTPGIPQGHWLDDDQTYALACLGQYELLRAGCTTIVDYYRRPQALARAAERIGLRAFVGGRIMDADPAALAEGRLVHDPALGEQTLDDSLTLIRRWDGAADGRIRCVHAPHAPDTCSRALLERVGALAQADGRPVHTHLAQSRLEVDAVRARDGLSPVQLLRETGLTGPRLFAAHAIHVDDTDTRLLGEAGVVVCHAPLGNAAGGAIAPIEALESAGAVITLCTDTKSADLFESMRMAIAGARIRAGGRFVFDARKAFDWATGGGARALGLAGSAGQIEPGAPADLVVLEPDAPNLAPGTDPVGTVVHAAHAGNVRHVICDGRWLIRNGEPTHFDGREVVAAAREAAEALWHRARPA